MPYTAPCSINTMIGIIRKIVKHERSKVLFLSAGLLLLSIVIIRSCLSVTFAEKTLGAKRLVGIPGWNCAACHEAEIVLPAKHPNVKELEYSACHSCHEKQNISLTAKLPLSHIHQLNEVKCSDCHHLGQAPKPLKTEECLVCHGTMEEVAQSTESLTPNPHDSPHYGKEVDCNACHQAHARFQYFCAKCHEWKPVLW